MSRYEVSIRIARERRRKALAATVLSATGALVYGYWVYRSIGDRVMMSICLIWMVFFAGLAYYWGKKSRRAGFDMRALRYARREEEVDARIHELSLRLERMRRKRIMRDFEY